MLEKISADLKTRYSVILQFSEEAEAFLAERGYSPQYGVRELSRTVEKYVQMPLSNMILSHRFKEHHAWLADQESESISFIPVEEDNRL